MKKVIAILLVLVMVFALAACGSGNTPANTGGNTTPAPQNNTAGGNEAAPEKLEWPTKELTIYSGYEAGSLTDNNIVTIKDWIVQQTGIKVTIENDKNGGGANLANKLVKADADGSYMMMIGINCIGNYYNGIWAVNPADDSQFKVVCGCPMPDPYCGSVLLTQESSPYSNWKEFADYVKAHPGEVTVMDIPGKVMDMKTKSILIQTGLYEYIKPFPTSSADSTAGLLGGTINVVMLDESTAAKLLADPSNKVKAIISDRPDESFAGLEKDPNFELIKSIPTLVDEFGQELATQYNCPNTSAFVVPAATPDDVVETMAKIINAIGDEPESTDPESFYMRVRANGGTSKFYTWPGTEIMAEWQRLDPIIKQIIETNKK